MKKRMTLAINGMECPNCALVLESIEDRLEGVLFAEASYRKAELTVEFDDARTSLEQIRTEVQRLGYQAA